MNCVKHLLILVIAAGFAAPSRAAADSEKRIGVVGPLTGPIAIVGESMRNAITLENEKASGSPRLVFLFEDDQFDPKLSAAAVRKLIDVDKVHALIVFGSAAAFAGGNLAEQAGIPMVALAFSEKVTEGKRYVFRMFQTARQQAELMAKEIERRKYDGIALVSGTNEATIAMRNALRAAAKAAPAADEEVAPNDFDLRGIALKVAQAKPQAIALFVAGPQLSALAVRFRELGYRGDFCGASTMQNLAQISAAKGALEGAWFAALDMSNAKEFLAEYQKRFSTPITPDGILAYDIAALIRQAARSGDIAQAIRAMQYHDGIFGRHQKIGDNSFDSALVIKRVENGQVVVAQ